MPLPEVPGWGGWPSKVNVFARGLFFDSHSFQWGHRVTKGDMVRRPQFSASWRWSAACGTPSWCLCWVPRSVMLARERDAPQWCLCCRVAGQPYVSHKKDLSAKVAACWDDSAREIATHQDGVCDFWSTVRVRSRHQDGVCDFWSTVRVGSRHTKMVFVISGRQYAWVRDTPRWCLLIFCKRRVQGGPLEASGVRSGAEQMVSAVVFLVWQCRQGNESQSGESLVCPCSCRMGCWVIVLPPRRRKKNAKPTVRHPSCPVSSLACSCFLACLTFHLGKRSCSGIVCNGIVVEGFPWMVSSLAVKATR